MPTITALAVHDVRFPTAAQGDGSDAINRGDYSATYVELSTDHGAVGAGLTFTNGRGNEITCAAVRALAHHVVGRTVEDIFAAPLEFLRSLTADVQLRWLGPEKGVIHMATGAIVNAVWDLRAKLAGKPMWQLLAELPPADLVAAIANMARLAEADPYWIEEPTHADDVLGHARIAAAVAPVRVATGEVAANRVIFKQLLQAGAIGVCQVDACRVAGVSEVLAVLLMAAKFGVPVCPHAGGVGLCEYVQHLSIFDYLRVSGSLQGRMVEYVDHLHEHFEDPVTVVNGRYLLPTAPGYSVT